MGVHFQSTLFICYFFRSLTTNPILSSRSDIACLSLLGASHFLPVDVMEELKPRSDGERTWVQKTYLSAFLSCWWKAARLIRPIMWKWDISEIWGAMACRQIVPGRRWCRFRPFLMVLVLAAYLFYQTLMPLRSKRTTIPTSGNGLLPNKAAEVQHQTHQVLARRVSCFLPSNKQKGQKEVREILQVSNKHCW